MSLDFNKVKEEIKTNLNRLQEDQRNFHREMKSSQNEYIKNIDMIKKTFETTLLTVVKEYEALIGPMESKKNSVLKGDVDNIKVKLKEAVQGVNTTLQKQGKMFENNLDNLIKTSTDTLKQDLNKISSHVEQVYGSEENAINVIRDSLINSVDRAKELYSNAVKQRIESVRSATTDMLDDVMSNLRKFREDASAVTRGGQNEIDALIREIIVEVESSYERSSASLRDIMGTIEENIKNIFTTKEDEFKTISANLTETAITHIKDNSEQLDDVKTKFEEKFTSFKAHETNEFKNILNDAKSSFINVVEITDNASSKEFQNTSDFFKNKLFNSINDVTKDFNLFYDQTISLYESLISQLVKSKETLESSKDKLVTGSINNIASIGEQMESSFHSMVDFLKSNFEKDKSNIQRDLETKLESYDKAFSSRLSSLESEILNSLSTSVVQQKDVLNKQESDITIYASEHTNKVKETLGDLTQDIRSEMDAFIVDQKRLIDTSSLDIQKKLQENQSEIISKLESIPPQVVSIGDTFEETRQEKFERASNEMDNAIDLFEREINDWAGDLNSIIGQEVSSVQRNIGDRQKESKELFNSVASDLSNRQSELSNNNNEKINEIANDLNTQFNTLGTSVTSNIDQYINQFDNQLTKFIEKGKEQSHVIDKKAQDFQEQSSGFKTSSQESFEKLETSSKFQLENILKPADKLIKTLDTAIVQSKKPT